jgi:hypothetical protein
LLYGEKTEIHGKREKHTFGGEYGEKNMKNDKCPL